MSSRAWWVAWLGKRRASWKYHGESVILKSPLCFFSAGIDDTHVHLAHIRSSLHRQLFWKAQPDDQKMGIWSSGETTPTIMALHGFHGRCVAKLCMFSDFCFFLQQNSGSGTIEKSSNAWMAAFHWEFQVMADVFVFLPTHLDNSSTIMIKPAGFSLTSFLQISRHFLGSWVCEILRPSSTETFRSDFAACSLILYGS